MSPLICYDEPKITISPFNEEVFEGSFFDRAIRDISETVWPQIDIFEEPDAFVLKADIPGLEKDDVAINIEGRTLTISGDKRESKREKSKGNYYHLERSFGSFNRCFTLPSNIDEKKIEAHYKNGVLELTLKKTKEFVSKVIEVNME
jgi:HSP20 family protein